MADIFLSYASEDHERARVLADALVRHGWSVWWDRKIPAGSSYRDVIPQELTSARCVVVLWSRQALRSDWVQDEADVARKRRRLVPVLLEAVKPPLGFAGIQTADLTRWRNDPSHAGFRGLLGALEGILGRPSLAPRPKSSEVAEEKVIARKGIAKAEAELTKSLWWRRGAFALGLLILAVGVGLLVRVQRPNGPLPVVDDVLNGKPTPVAPDPAKLEVRSVLIKLDEGQGEFYINGVYGGDGSTYTYRGYPGEQFKVRISRRGKDNDIEQTVTVGERDKIESLNWGPE